MAKAKDPSASTSSSSESSKYDVFLSFQGNDTRYAFTGHLYKELLNAGLLPFLDDDGIERGEDINSELQKAICQSKVSVIVLSESYPTSRWCLDELVMILERRRRRGLAVIPVFYNVDPSHLRRQTGSVAEAFRRHVERFEEECDERGAARIRRWKEALTEIANLGGMHFSSQFDGYEYKCIETVVKEVQDKMGRPPLNVASHLVGIDYHVRNVNKLLKRKSNGVDIIMIHGIGGIGKTTIAKLVYNYNCIRFDSSSFLINIRELFERPNSLVHLQKRFLCDILRQQEIKKPKSIDDGWSHIKRALRFKGSVFIVLDDVDKPSQLDDLLQMKNWLAKGSKIIITARRLDFPKADEDFIMYEVEKLNVTESLKLFMWHAFGTRVPGGDYVRQAKCFVEHCEGLPLALKVLGSSLCRKNLAQWKDQWEKLKAFSKGDITETLKLSFKSLEDDNDKNIFLDIACFFVGLDKDFTTKVLQGCDFYAVIGIQNLIDRCLLKIDEENKLEMHQLIQEMGKQIVHDESWRCPEKRSRLWKSKDSLDVLRFKTGTECIEGLVLDLQNSKREALETDAFKRMDKLRLLQLNYAYLNGCYKVLPKRLRWLCWHGCPLKFIPNDFPMEEIVVLDMRYSSLKHLWSTTKFLGFLKILNCSHSLLIRTPDFSTVPNLEKLVLKDCPKLVEIHISLSNLEKLVILNVENCKCLRKLPRNMCLMKSLDELIISGCSSLEWAAEELKMMSSLKSFVADGISIGKLISSDKETSPWFTSMFPAWLSRQGRISGEKVWTSLPSSLVNLSLANCNLSDFDFPKEFSNLTMLKHLNLSRNQFRYVPDCLRTGLPNLERLYLRQCEELNLVEWSSIQLQYLDVSHCPSLVKIAYNTLDSPWRCSIDNNECKKLSQIKDSFRVKLTSKLDVEALNSIGFFNLDSMKESKITYTTGIFETVFPGQEVPDWFTYRSNNLVMSLVVPSHPSNVRIRGFNLCLVYEDLHNIDRIEVEVINKTKNLWASYCIPIPTNFTYFHSLPKPTEATVWLSYWLFGILFEADDHMEASFIIINGYRSGQMKGCGIHFLYEEDEMKQVKHLKSLLLSGLFSQFMCEELKVTNGYSIFSRIHPGSEIPMWLSHKSINSTISLVVPSSLVKIQSLNLCVVYAIPPSVDIPWVWIHAEVINNRRDVIAGYDVSHAASTERRANVWLSYWVFDDRLECGDEIQVYVSAKSSNCQIKEWGVNFLYDGEAKNEMERLQDFCSHPIFFHVYLDVDRFSSLMPKEFFDGDFQFIMAYSVWQVEEEGQSEETDTDEAEPDDTDRPLKKRKMSEIKLIAN